MRIARLAAIFLLTSLAAASLATGSPPSSNAVLKHGPPAFLIGHSASLNWSGYSSYTSSNGTFTDVKGSWVQPTATCTNKTTYSSFWAGLDGYNSNSVEQLGTEADCSHGSPQYYAWWEMYPNPSNSIRGFTITPGQPYTAEVKYNGNNSFTLTLSGGGNTSFSTTQTLANTNRTSAEWIAEAPAMCAGSCRVLPLTNFGSVNFSGSSANGQAINNTAWNYDPLTMVTNGGQPRATPSALTANGTAFSVAWSHN
jgi:hypothetical protein